MRTLTNALERHVRFYIALACGGAAYAAGMALKCPAPLLAAGDVFYLAFLGLCVAMVAGQTAADLKARARTEDEGMGVVVLIMLAAIGFFCVAVFAALNRKHFDAAAFALAAAGALLGWFALHTAMAFHYADVHYFEEPGGRGGDLQFPGRGDPGPWDFLYFSFVVGMTAQVSDVQVTTPAMRRVVLWHGVASFFFNTVFIAMAVNAGVSLAS